MSVDYAVVVPAYNEEVLLAETIASIREMMASSPATGELIVVDNNSTDRTSQIAQQCGADQVVFEPHNQIAKARNTGAQATRAGKLFFIDADTKVPAATFTKALQLLDSGNIAGGGARLIMDQPVSPIVNLIVKTWDQASDKLGYAAGSFFFCRRDAFDAVGGFDETVYAGEEVWLARSIKKWGKQRGLSFQIIAEPRVETSARKSDWFSTSAFVWQLVIFFLFPWATKNRKLCGIWYRRP